MKQLTLRMDETFHRQLKALAALEGRNMGEMILEWLQEKAKRFLKGEPLDQARMKEKIIGNIASGKVSAHTRTFTDEEIAGWIEEDRLPEKKSSISKRTNRK